MYIYKIVKLIFSFEPKVQNKKIIEHSSELTTVCV